MRSLWKLSKVLRVRTAELTKSRAYLNVCRWSTDTLRSEQLVSSGKIRQAETVTSSNIAQTKWFFSWLVDAAARVRRITKNPIDWSVNKIFRYFQKFKLTPCPECIINFIMQ